MERIATREQLEALRDQAVAARPAERKRVSVCGGTGCQAAGDQSRHPPTINAPDAQLDLSRLYKIKAKNRLIRERIRRRRIEHRPARQLRVLIDRR